MSTISSQFVKALIPCSLVCLMSTGCSLQSNPSEAEAHMFFESKLSNAKGISGEGIGSFRVASFQKTDGLSSTEGGVQNYSLMYSANVEYPEGNNAFCLDNSSPPPGETGLRCLSDFANAQAVGAVQNLRGVVKFTRTESGWKPQEISIKCDRGHMSHNWCSL